jgi:hypothetical protein
VARAGQPMTRGECALPADLAAVRLTAVVPSADEERSEAPHAGQLVDGDGRVQGAGGDRQKLGRRPVPCDELAVDGPALGLRPKVRAGDSGLHSFGAARIVLPQPVAGQFPEAAGRAPAAMWLRIPAVAGFGHPRRGSAARRQRAGLACGAGCRRRTSDRCPDRRLSPFSPDPLRGGASRTRTSDDTTSVRRAPMNRLRRN